MQSESIAKLAEALSKAQGKIKGASKDTANPFFKSKYADLASVWDACREQLSAHGLSVIQTTDNAPEGVCVVTTLAHSSGEWIRGKLTMQPVKNDPQGVGSAITYARRYALAAMVGVAPEDDDGNAASGHNGNAARALPAAAPEMRPVNKDQWSGPRNKSTLNREMKQFSHDLEGCADLDQLDALVASNEELLEQCRKDWPACWLGEGDHRGAKKRIEERRAELNPANYINAA